MEPKQARCASLNHPAGCCNPWLGETFCICGTRRYVGQLPTTSRPMPPDGWTHADEYSYDEFTGEWAPRVNESAA